MTIPLHKSFPTVKEGVKLASTWNAQLSFPTQGRSHACFLKVHPSPASPQNKILSHLYVGKDSSPFKMQNPYKSFPTKYFLYLYFSCYFYLSIYFFFFLLLLFPSIFFQPWNSSPKWKNYSPAFGANNRRIDTPAPTHYPPTRTHFHTPHISPHTIHLHTYTPPHIPHLPTHYPPPHKHPPHTHISPYNIQNTHTLSYIDTPHSRDLINIWKKEGKEVKRVWIWALKPKIGLKITEVQKFGPSKGKKSLTMRRNSFFGRKLAPPAPKNQPQEGTLINTDIWVDYRKYVSMHTPRVSEIHPEQENLIHS